MDYDKLLAKATEAIKTDACFTKENRKAVLSAPELRWREKARNCGAGFHVVRVREKPIGVFRFVDCDPPCSLLRAP